MGSDYKIRQKSQMWGHSAADVPANVTRYFSIGTGVPQRERTILFSEDGHIDFLIAGSELPPGAGETYTYTVMINSIATALTCQTAGAVAVQSGDVLNGVAVVRGDEMEFRIVTSALAAVCMHWATFSFRQT